MECERCGRETDIIRHLRIPKKVNLIFKHNNSKDTMICIQCHNNKPEFKGLDYLVETIRND